VIGDKFESIATWSHSSNYAPQGDKQGTISKFVQEEIDLM